MGYSRNPDAYSEEEQAIMLTALGRDITLNFPSSKAAFNQRGRFYALRKAALMALEKNLKMKKQGFDDLIVDLPIVHDAVTVQKVRIVWANDAKTSITLGRNVTDNTGNNSILREALGEGYRTNTDMLNQEAEEQTNLLKQFADPLTGEIDHEAYMKARGHASTHTDEAITQHLNNMKEKTDPEPAADIAWDLDNPPLAGDADYEDFIAWAGNPANALIIKQHKEGKK